MYMHSLLSCPPPSCSFLCFERHSRSQRDPDRFHFSLMDVVQVVKAKPFAVLPGSGMSVELTLKNGNKVGVACGCGLVSCLTVAACPYRANTF